MMLGNIYQEGTLHGSISSEGTLCGSISSEGNLTGHVDILPGSTIQNGEPYKGSYEVEPEFSDKSLPTKDKYLSKDLIVKSIPYSEIGNNSGGLTINIGG